MNSLIRFLGEFCGEHLFDEKIFVVPSYQVGHQIGESLTKAGHSWVNLRFATLPSMAQEYAGLDISQEDVSQISESSAVILLSKVFSAFLDEGRLGYFGELKPSPGIIRALHKSLYALRMDGIKSDDLAPESFINEKKGQEIRLVLKKYEEELERNKFIDLPGLYFMALESDEESHSDQEKYFLILQNSSLSNIIAVCWRLKNKQEVEEKSLIFKLIPLEKLRNIEDYTLFFVDMVKVESSKVLQEIVDALENLYDGNDEIVLNRDLVVESIPEKLMETWSQPIRLKDED